MHLVLWMPGSPSFYSPIIVTHLNHIHKFNILPHAFFYDSTTPSYLVAPLPLRDSSIFHVDSIWFLISSPILFC